MNVFLSWSGERSKQVAVLLKEWLKCVIQAVHPWVSSKDIDRGSLWFTEISQRLGETSVGIVCLTAENKEKPWILFEAGALAKGLNAARVCTLLIDLEPQDVADPLAQFNHTSPTKEGMSALISTLNTASGAPLLDEGVLARAFETYWPQFETEFKGILANTKSAPTKPRANQDILAEILNNTRSLSTRIRKLEERGSPSQSMSAAELLGSDPAKFKIYFDQLAKSDNERARDALLGLRNEWAHLVRKPGDPEEMV